MSNALGPHMVLDIFRGKFSKITKSQRNLYSRFDYPLLKAEMEKCVGKLENNVLCADSYIAIRSILKSRNNILSTTSFSLINLHQKFFGCQPEMSLGAEADCLTLLKVTAVLCAEFIDWVEDNYYKFRHCNAMWNML